MNYKVYKKVTYIFMAIAYVCFLFKVSIVFEDFLGSVFCLLAAITGRIYYTKEIKILRRIKEPNEDIKKRINQTIGVSFVAPLSLGIPAVVLLIYGIQE